MNQTYKLSGPYEFAGEDTPEQTLTETRERALDLWRSGDIMLRSCWVCNRAHVHLIQENDTVLNCFGCGHFYLGGVDVTDME